MQLSIVEGQRDTTQRKSGHNGLWLCGLEVIGSVLASGQPGLQSTILNVMESGRWPHRSQAGRSPGKVLTALDSTNVVSSRILGSVGVSFSSQYFKNN